MKKLISTLITAVVLMSGQQTLAQKLKSDSDRIQTLVALNSSEFAPRLSEALELLQTYSFNGRSKREREDQIREYLRLSIKTLAADQSFLADQYIFDAYTMYPREFDEVLNNISRSRYHGETLTPGDVARIKSSFSDVRASRNPAQPLRAVDKKGDNPNQ